MSNPPFVFSLERVREVRAHEEDLAREAFRLGALAYVDKPFDLGYLKRVVAMALDEGVDR